MELQYTIILSLWAVNWVVSIWYWLRATPIHTGVLGCWLAAVYITQLICLGTLEPIGWKHGTLMGLSCVMIFVGFLNVMAPQHALMKTKHIVIGVITSLLWLWLLLS